MAWTNESKHTSTFTGQGKNTSTWDKGTWYLLQENGDFLLQENGDKIVLSQSWNFKNPRTFTGETKHTSNYSNHTKNTSIWTNQTKH